MSTPSQPSKGEQPKPDPSNSAQPNPYAGLYGLPAPEGWVPPHERDAQGTKQHEESSAQQTRPDNAASPNKRVGGLPAYPAQGQAPSSRPADQNPFPTTSNGADYLPGTGQSSVAVNNGLARGDFPTALMDAPWVPPHADAPRPSAANNWNGWNTFGAVWGRGWALWRKGAGPLAIGLLIFVFLPLVPLLTAAPEIIRILAAVDFTSQANLDVAGLQTKIVNAYPSMPAIALSNLLTVLGSVCYTNGIMHLVKHGQVKLSDFLTYRHAVSILVVGLLGTLISMINATSGLSLVYGVLTLFAGYVAVHEGLSVGSTFMRSLNVSGANFIGILVLLLWFVLLIGGGAVGFGFVGVIIGSLFTGSIGIAGALAVSMVLPLLSLIITYPVWLCMVASSAVRAAKKVDYLRAVMKSNRG